MLVWRVQISVRKTMNTRKPPVQPKKKSEEKVIVEEEVETVVEEWEEVQIDDLVNELESMRAAMYQLEAKNAQLEDKVREEVCEEMMKQMQNMEQAFEVRIEDERIATEQKFMRKLQIISREISRREEVISDEEVHELQGQLKFYEQRVADMQREHKSTLQRLLPGSQAGGEGGSAGAAATEDGSSEEMRHRCAVLEAQVAALQKESDEKSEALEVKRRQQNESRLVLEEADSVIRQLESKVKGLEDQNDRLREELKVRRAQQAPDEPEQDSEMATKLQLLEKALAAEQEKVIIYSYSLFVML